MDIGTAFLLGVLVGQWVLLFIIWRVLNRLVDLISDAGTNSSPPPSRNIIDYKPLNDDITSSTDEEFCHGNATPLSSPTNFD